MKLVNSVTQNQQLVQALLKWFSQNARDLPWRKTCDPYAIWISEIMLQQTQVKTVIPFWQRWMRELPTIESLATAKQERVLKLWEGLGYYTRARNLQIAAQLICEKHNRRFPQDFDSILALPGIGRYTAGAICSIAYNQPAPILDGNVIRVLTRIFGIAGNPREKQTNTELWRLAGQLVIDSKIQNPKSKSSCSFLNQSLMELGALVCTPRQPKCADCPAQTLCFAHQKNRAEEFPNLEKRAEVTKRQFVAFIVERDKKFLVRQRPAKVVNANLWEFPNVELNGDNTVLERQPFRFERNASPICTIQHSITRYRIRLDAFSASVRTTSKISDGKWLNLLQLEKLAFSSAHRQILRHLGQTRTSEAKPSHI